ncbi:MAG: pantoate kinase [Methanoregula sp.]
MTVKTVTAFCPGHISGYFRRVDGHDLATTGSIGSGIVIDEGVTVIAHPSRTTDVYIRRIDRNGHRVNVAHTSPPILSALNRIGVSASIVTECRLPIGAGFGLSAAALLASLTAVNQLEGCGMSPDTIAGIAHETEVVFRTGLGDVSACQAGGWVVRTGAGIKEPIERHYDLTQPLFAVSFGPIHTPAVLGSPAQMAQVTAAFPASRPESVADLFRLSREFAEQSGLVTPEVKEALRACDAVGIPASMTMLGNGVFAYGTRAGSVLRAFGEVYEFHIAQRGVRLMETTS